jgi:dihydrofolate reductase
MRIVVTEFLSLDGVMEDPRWTFDFDRGEEGNRFKWEELFDAESLLLGRVTYQGFATAWPNMGGDDFGKRMNEIHKYVVSSTLADSDATWGDTTILRGDPAAAVARLRQQPGGTALVEGSAELVQALTRHGLVDEYRLMLFPVVLGTGKRLFPQDMPGGLKLRLVESTVAGTGVLMLRYAAGAT